MKPSLGFVVLRHQVPAGSARKSHFDLMFEQNGVLLTWAAEELPERDHAIHAERIDDHRIEYLDYEGEIAGGRGRVTQVDRGSCHPLTMTEQLFRFDISGDVLQGQIEFRRLEPAGDQRWRVLLCASENCEPDEDSP